jgi:hypothetical protein
MILANRHGKRVRFVLQPQRAAFPSSSVPLWSGVGVDSTGPRGMSGGLAGSDPAPHRSRDPAPTRRTSLRRQDHSVRRSPTTLASCTSPPGHRHLCRHRLATRSQHRPGLRHGRKTEASGGPLLPQPGKPPVTLGSWLPTVATTLTSAPEGSTEPTTATRGRKSVVPLWPP